MVLRSCTHPTSEAGTDSIEEGREGRSAKCLTVERTTRRWAAVLSCLLALGLLPTVEASSVGASTQLDPAVGALLDAPGFQPITRLAQRFELTEFLNDLMATIAAQSESEVTEFGYTYLVGDLSGDGRDDAVITHYRVEIVDEENFTFKSRITSEAVEGDTGRRLWVDSVSGENLLLFPIPARVGSKGHDGVWLIEFRGALIGPTERTYVVRALDHRGKQVWRKENHSTIVGYWPIAYAADDLLVTLDIFDALPGKASELLIASGPIVQPSWDAAFGSITARVVDGRNGNEEAHFGAQLATGFLPFAAAAQNLDDKPGHDYVFVNEGSDVELEPEDPIGGVHPAGGILFAINGRTGESLWKVHDLQLRNQNVLVEDLGHVVGNGHGDLSVSTVSVESGGPQEKYHSHLVDGAGAIAWDAPGAYPYSAGDINGDGQGDFLVQSFYSDDGFVATRVWARSSRGKKLWAKEYVTEHPSQTCCSAMFIFGGTWGVGDMTGDGLVEGGLWHPAGSFARGTRIEEYLVVDPQRGRLLMREEEIEPLGVSVDRGTADAFEVDWHVPNDLIIRLRNGPGGRVLTETRLRFDRPLDPTELDAYAKTARLDRDACTDLAVTVYTPAENYEVVISSATGRVLWDRALSKRPSSVSMVGRLDHNLAC